jgi:hypothetical protein
MLNSLAVRVPGFQSPERRDGRVRATCSGKTCENGDRVRDRLFGKTLRASSGRTGWRLRSLELFLRAEPVKPFLRVGRKNFGEPALLATGAPRLTRYGRLWVILTTSAHPTMAYCPIFKAFLRRGRPWPRHCVRQKPAHAKFIPGTTRMFREIAYSRDHSVLHRERMINSAGLLWRNLSSVRERRTIASLRQVSG